MTVRRRHFLCGRGLSDFQTDRSNIDTTKRREIGSGGGGAKTECRDVSFV
jgi:hypothetical protein